MVWIDDLKTGWQSPDPRSVQMLFYALVAARSLGQQDAVVSITHWRRNKPEPEPRLWAVLSMADLNDFETKLQESWKRTRSGHVAVLGPWCRYCPSVKVCPGHTESKKDE
jgi:hypothetical protein